MLSWLWERENHILRERGKGIFLSHESEPGLLERLDDERRFLERCACPIVEQVVNLGVLFMEAEAAVHRIPMGPCPSSPWHNLGSKYAILEP